VGEQDHGSSGSFARAHWPVLFGGEIVFGAVLGFLFLGSHSLWLDESVSATLATAPWHRFTDVVAHREPNMALYYLLLRGWTVFGHSEAVLRIPSVFAALGALAVVIVVARELFDERVALLAGLLLAVDPLFVQYAQDVRGYALCLLLVSASSWLFILGIQRPGTRPWATWVGYALLSAFAAYSNFWAALVPLAHAASLGFLRKDRILWRRLIPAGAALVVLLVPLALLIRATDNAGTNWAAGSSAGKLITRIRSTVPHLALDVAVLLGIVIVLGVVSWLRRRPAVLDVFDRQWPLFFTGCWLLVPIVTVVLLSLVDKPLLVIRYLMVSLPPVALLLAVLLVSLWQRRSSGHPQQAARFAAVLVLVAALVFSGIGVAGWYAKGGPQDFRSVVSYLATVGKPGDGVLIYAPYERIPVEWYLEEHPRARGALHPVDPSLPWGVNPLYFDGNVSISEADVERSAVGFPRVWLVIVSADQHLYPASTSAVEEGLTADGFVVVSSRSFRGVTVLGELWGTTAQPRRATGTTSR
jgi:mannosyltransferase